MNATYFLSASFPSPRHISSLYASASLPRLPGYQLLSSVEHNRQMPFYYSSLVVRRPALATKPPLSLVADDYLFKLFDLMI